MLNTYAHLEGYKESVSQTFNKELIMQGFEAAYKFDVNDEKFPKINLRYFFDTFDQYAPSLDSKMQIDDSISFIDDYETKYNTRQIIMELLSLQLQVQQLLEQQA